MSLMWWLRMDRLRDLTTHGFWCVIFRHIIHSFGVSPRRGRPFRLGGIQGTALRAGKGRSLARSGASGGVFLTLPAQPEQNTSTYGRVTNENLGAEARAELAHDAEERDGA